MMTNTQCVAAAIRIADTGADGLAATNGHVGKALAFACSHHGYATTDEPAAMVYDHMQAAVDAGESNDEVDALWRSTTTLRSELQREIQAEMNR